MSLTMISTEEQSVVELFRPQLKKRIAEDDYTLPMLPKVASEVMSMTNDLNADMSDLSNLIHKDQALAGHVMRIANSAAYAGGEKIVSLNQAVARLGMSLLGDIAIAASLQNGIFAAPGFDEHIKTLWAQSLASGAYGKEIARFKRHNVEGQFLCSLLHAIGKPIVLQLIAQINRDLGKQVAKNALYALIEEFHCELGGKIAEKWKLPQQVMVAVQYYKNYQDAPSFKKEATMTYLSHQLAVWCMDSAELSKEDVEADPVFIELNFYPDDVEDMLSKKEDVQEVVKSMAL